MNSETKSKKAKKVMVGAHVRKTVHARLTILARKNDKSLAAYIRRVLEDHVRSAAA